jgi:hypothetical protein
MKTISKHLGPDGIGDAGFDPQVVHHTTIPDTKEKASIN